MTLQEIQFRIWRESSLPKSEYRKGSLICLYNENRIRYKENYFDGNLRSSHEYKHHRIGKREILFTIFILFLYFISIDIFVIDKHWSSRWWIQIWYRFQRRLKIQEKRWNFRWALKHFLLPSQDFKKCTRIEQKRTSYQQHIFSIIINIAARI